MTKEERLQSLKAQWESQAEQIEALRNKLNAVGVHSLRILDELTDPSKDDDERLGLYTRGKLQNHVVLYMVQLTQFLSQQPGNKFTGSTLTIATESGMDMRSVSKAIDGLVTIGAAATVMDQNRRLKSIRLLTLEELV